MRAAALVAATIWFLGHVNGSGFISAKPHFASLTDIPYPVPTSVLVSWRILSRMNMISNARHAPRGVGAIEYRVVVGDNIKGHHQPYGAGWTMLAIPNALSNVFALDLHAKSFRGVFSWHERWHCDGIFLHSWKFAPIYDYRAFDTHLFARGNTQGRCLSDIYEPNFNFHVGVSISTTEGIETNFDVKPCAQIAFSRDLGLIQGCLGGVSLPSSLLRTSPCLFESVPDQPHAKQRYGGIGKTDHNHPKSPTSSALGRIGASLAAIILFWNLGLYGFQRARDAVQFVLNGQKVYWLRVCGWLGLSLCSAGALALIVGYWMSLYPTQS